MSIARQLSLLESVTGVVTVPSTAVSVSTLTGALVVQGGTGIAGNTYIGGNLVVLGTITGLITTATTNATAIQTSAQPNNSIFYPTFVTANNAVPSFMNLGTTSTLVINPSTGNVGIGTSSPGAGVTMAGGLSILGTGPTQLTVQKGVSTGFALNVGEVVAGDTTFYDSASGSFARSLSLRAGSVGINNTAPAYKLDVGGPIGHTAGIIDTSGTGAALRIVSPAGGSYATSVSTVTGAIKIRLPNTVQGTMLKMTVKVYTYDGQSFDIHCGGYTYTGNTWYNMFAYMGTQSRGTLNVRFGHDGTYFCILIGETSTVWNYPQVFVTDFQAGFSSYAGTSWTGPFAITFETTLPTIAATQATYQPVTNNGGSWNINAASASNALPLAGGTMTGLLVGRSNASGGYAGSNDTGSFSARGDASNGAFMSFHRTGVYAINVGLDTDNIWKVGGWSAGSTYVGVSAGQLLATSEVTAYYSDGRLKTNLGNITGALDAVQKLNGFRYTNNELAKSFGYNDDKVHLGVNAQEVEALFPEIVTIAPFDITTDPDTGKTISKSGENYKTVRYEKLVPVLIEAIKEQQQQIAQLSEMVNKLVNK
jgi:hypothetical protein